MARKKKKGGINYLFGGVPDLPKKAPPPSKHERQEHGGRVPQVGVPSGPRQTVAASPGSPAADKPVYNPATGTYSRPNVAGPPAPSSAKLRRSERRAERAATHQARLVDQFVTKAYSRKVDKIKSKAPTYEVADRVQKAKDEVESLRERLLTHPAVEGANSEGKVVPAKGLQKLHARTTAQTHDPFAIKMPTLKGARRQEKQSADIHRLLTPHQATKPEVPALTTSKSGEPRGKRREGYDPNGLAIAVERNVIEPAKQAGVLPKEKTFGQKAYQRIAEYGPLAISAAPEAAAGAKALGAILKGAQAGEVRLGGSLLSSPLRASSLGEDVAISMRAAERAGAKGLGRLGQGKADRALVRGLTGTTSRKEFASQAGLPLKGLKVAGISNTEPGRALAKGQASAIRKDPGQVASATASLFPGLLVGAAQLPVGLGTSAARAGLDASGIKHYTSKEIAAPTSEALDEQKNFVEHFLKVYGSGKARRVEKATLEEGLLPEVLIAPLGGKVAELSTRAARAKRRGLIEGRRAPLTDESGNVIAHEHGGPVKRGTQRTPLEAQPTTRLGEHRAHRNEEAFHAAAMNDVIALETAKRRAGVDKYARKAAGKRRPVRENLGERGKLRHRQGQTLHERAPDYIPFLVRAGIDPHNPEAALREIQHYGEHYKGLDHPTSYGLNPEALTARDAVRFFTEHPDELKSKNLAKAVDEYRAMANGERGFRSLSTSDRNRYLGHAVMHDILDARDRVPVGARTHTDATTREGAWIDLKQREKTIKSLRREGRKKYDQAQALEPKSEKATKLRGEAKATYEKARAIDKGRRELHDELKNYTRPGAKADPNAKRIAYDEALEKEMVAEARASLKEKGLHPEPAYIPDQSAIARATGDESTTGGAKPLPAAQKINEGLVWEHGLARQGYEHLMNEGIMRQVARHYQFEDWKRFRVERGIQFEGAYQHNGKTWAKAFAQGVINPKDVVLVPKQAINRLETKTMDGTPTEYEQALAEAQAARKVSPQDAESGTIYEAFPKVAYGEKLAQVQRSNVPGWISQANSITSRAMLSTPSFIGAQIAAETAQAIAEVNPYRMVQGLRAYSKLTPGEKARISGVSGETARAIFSPEDLQTALGSHNAKPFRDALGFFRRNVFGRAAKSVLEQRWAGEVNRATGSYTRRAVLTGVVLRDLNGLTAKFRKVLHIQTEIQKQIGHLKPKEQLAYLAERPELLDRYTKRLNDAMGGWTNLTRTGKFPETARAAMLVFYPFLRMSLQWPLKYAVNHPIKGTALAYLAAENNWALRKALEGEPSFLNYAQIPVYGVGENGKPTVINLARAAPGGNALVAAVQGSGSLLGALQPVLAAGITGATGQGPLGPIEGGVLAHVKAGAASILSLSPYIRAADTLAGQKASGQSEFGILGRRANVAVEPLQALESKLKGDKGGQLVRSLGFPFAAQDIEKERDKAKLGRILGDLSKYGSDAQSKVQATSYGDERGVRKTVVGMQKKYDKAHGELEALYKKHGLGKVAKRSEEIYFYTHPYPGSEEKSSPYGGGGYDTGGYETGGYGGATGPGKPPAFPHASDSGVSFKLPGLPNVSGAIPGFLGTLIGGETAQAAEVPKRKPVTLSGPLTPTQKVFGKELVKQTHLTPKTVGGWLLAEDSGSAAQSKEASGDYNYLNIGPGYTLSSNPKVAARETAALINTSHYYAGIRASVGKGTGAQVAAISASPWDVAHYPNGIPTNLVQGSASNVLLKGDVQRGQGGRVKVRADAKGMVKWAKALVGTQEGSQLQQKWAAQSGVSSSEPWCSEFIAAGIARRGLPAPSNPAYSGAWLTWKGGKHIGTDASKAKPGDIIVFGSNPGYTSHVGLYVGGGRMISGNWSDEVATANVSDESEPIAGIVRPKYKGGMVSVAAGAPLPGSALGPTGSPISAPAVALPASGAPTPAATNKKAREGQKKRGMTPAQRLKLVEEITSGNLTRFGIPSPPPRTPTVANLAELGRSLEAGRQELARL